MDCYTTYQYIMRATSIEKVMKTRMHTESAAPSPSQDRGRCSSYSHLKYKNQMYIHLQENLPGIIPSSTLLQQRYSTWHGILF